MIHTFECEVIQTTNVTVEIDDDEFTPEYMAEFRKSFCRFDSLEEHAAHIAQLQARGMIHFDGFVEGYGHVNGIDGPYDKTKIKVKTDWGDIEVEAVEKREPK